MSISSKSVAADNLSCHLLLYSYFQDVLYVKDWIIDETPFPPSFAIGSYRTIALVYSRIEGRNRMIIEYQFNFSIQYKSFNTEIDRKNR